MRYFSGSLRRTSLLAFGFAVSALLNLSQPALAQFSQQSKLNATGAGSQSQEGISVAVSANGNTAITGGNGDNSGVGAAWIYFRSTGVWGLQGSKLVGTGAVGSAGQGHAVALSADGNTAISGGSLDNSSAGAVWVFTRSGTTWTQQGLKLVGTGAIGAAHQGISVALSADGNTALVGGYLDNSQTGGVWVFTRSGGIWTQQGSKLVGTGGVGAPQQGWSVALSGDGNTAAIGGYVDNSLAGAVWVFTRNGGVWTQQGSKLVGTGASGAANQGTSVSLSGDGNTALVGGSADNVSDGAAWVFTRNGTVWTQQGSKLVGTGAVGHAHQGSSVALSSDGNTAVVGGNKDNASAGAIWVFTRSGSAWTQLGSKSVGTSAIGVSEQGVAVALSADAKTAIVGGNIDHANSGAAWIFAQPGAGSNVAMSDFDGDGKSDILWRAGDGSVAEWLMNGGSYSGVFLAAGVDNAWHIVGIGDFDGDGKSDILWRHDDGSVAIWLTSGSSFNGVMVATGVTNTWHIDAVGDFDGDGKSDILWRHDDGSVAIWQMNGGSFTGLGVASGVSSGWHIVGVGDFNGDGKSDILWRATDGSVGMWLMNGASYTGVGVADGVSNAYQIAGVGDFNGDGKSDILWRYTDGSVSIWQMNGGTFTGIGVANGVSGAWQIVGVGDFNGDGKSDILWRASDGSVAEWLMNGGSLTGAGVADGVSTAWATYQFPVVSASGP